MAYFSFVSLLEITAAIVASLPVPAVVGMAIKGGILFRTFRTPFKSGIDFLDLTTLAPTTFAQSIGDPPPTAMIPTQAFDSYMITASSTFVIVGLGTVLSYIV